MNHKAMLLLTIALIALNMVPGINQFLYPVTLLVTFIHEACHGLAAVMTGGSVISIAVNSDTSGLTWTAGGSRFMTIFAGYFGTLLVGALGTFALKHGAPCRAVLAALIGIMIFTVWHMGGSLFGTLWGLIIISVLLSGLVIEYLGEVLAPVLSIQLMLGAFYDLGTLFQLTTSSNAMTDAMIMRDYTGVPATVWALLWLGLSMLVAWKLLFTGLLKPAAPAYS